MAPVPDYPVLARIPAQYELVEFQLRFVTGNDRATLLNLTFGSPDGRLQLEFTNPWPLESAFALTDDRGEVVVYDIRADQWEDKRVKAEFFVESHEEFWADAVEVLPAQALTDPTA